MNILFTCAGRRNYLLRYFREYMSEHDKVLATDMSLLAPAMHEADIALQVPSIYDNTYVDSLLSIVQQYSVNAIISLNDLELPLLATNAERFKSVACQLLVSSSAVIDLCFDKMKTVSFLQSIGLNTPKTYTGLNDALQALEAGTLCFPLVVKPRWGSASIGIEFPQDTEELRLTFQLLRHKLSRTILATASKEDYDKALLIQQKIEGREYGMDILNDFNGNYVACFAREKMAMRAGETDKARSVVNPHLTEIGERIGKELKHIGNLDIDILEDQHGNFYVLEMNPRFGGGYPFSHEAGGCGVAAYVAWLNNAATPINKLAYTPGKVFSKCDRMIDLNINEL